MSQRSATARAGCAAAATGAVLALALAGCGGGTSRSERAAGSPAPGGSPADATVATLGDAPSTIASARTATVEVYRNPGDSSPNMRLHSPNPDGVVRVFLVLDQKPGWLHVLLPVPPNGSQGWLPDSEVTTTRTTYWIQVLRSAHRVKVYKGRHVVIDTPAAIGKTDTPTPGGRYYLTELLQAPNPNGAYGPYAYGLSGYSTTLTQFNGHDPIIGIHGTNDPKSIGKSMSHGCVRVSNAVIRRMAKMLPLGTPVQIKV